MREAGIHELSQCMQGRVQAARSDQVGGSVFRSHDTPCFMEGSGHTCGT
jgi:hypothetical protein